MYSIRSITYAKANTHERPDKNMTCLFWHLNDVLATNEDAIHFFIVYERYKVV